MKEYIISVAAAAVIGAVVNMIAPDKWAKYVSMATGLVIVMCIARPVFSLLDKNAFEGFSYEPEVSADAGEDMLRAEIKSELEARIEEDVQSRLLSEFGKECRAEAEAGVNENGEITGIDRIVIYGSGIDAAALARLRDVYGAAEVVIGR